MLAKLLFHLLRMDENVVTELVLNSKSCAVEPRVFQVSSRLVDIVRREDYFLARELVVQHQNRTIEQLELVVP